MLERIIGDTVGSTREHQHIKTEDLEQVSKESSQKHEALQARTRDRIRGSLMAGAAGDALGYTVEFMSRNSILAHYGSRGITQFELSADGQALVSDDTQMTLFTACGLLMGVTRSCMGGNSKELMQRVPGAYLDWYYTQTGRK